MKASFLLLPALLLAAMPAVPAAAQEAPDGRQVRTMVIFGKDRCPKGGPDEIVVCARRPEADRYRLSPELRREAEAAALRNWIERVHALDEAANVGIGSCSTVGPGGVAGCTLKSIERERQAP